MAKKIAPPDLNEVASTADGDDMLIIFQGELRQPRDEVLRTRGGDLIVYERILRDDQVKSCFGQRKTAAISREWRVEPGGPTSVDQAAADFIREQLHGVRFDRVCEKMLNGIHYGYAVGECLYKAENGQIMLDAIKVRRQRRFRFDREGRLRLISPGHPQGEVMPDNKFWIFTAGGDDDDDPYGLGLGHWLYWPVWLKRNGLRFWSVYMEKYAMPTALGKAPRGSDKDARNKLLRALRAISTERGVVVPAGVEIELLEAARSSGGDYATFYGLMNEAISKIILSQTMTTDNGSSKAQGQVHENRLKDVVKSDNDLLCESLNDGPVAWLTAWNFPTAARPRVYRDHTDAPDEKAQSERDKNLYELGYDPTPEYIQDTYGPGWVKRPAATVPAQIGATTTATPPTPADFAEGDGTPARDAADDLTDQMEVLAGDALSAMIDELGRVLDDATDLADVEKRLLEIGAAMPVDDLAKTLGDGLAVANLKGREDMANDG